ncbi:uncharacterized protein LOC128548023 [Mercenaria mercenaria]|uniref:uncharacterized protein LOC128548023 n=1 Tax=Mercenaria mercenaria TaxID=6596 RepID=UPI00234F92D4|nr:uncharacterized protein LOC128548023 [Mercenaria mercenaria]
MGNLAEDLAIMLIICAHQRAVTLAKPCSLKNSTATGSLNERCEESVIPKDNGDLKTEGDDPEDISGIASHTVYTIVVVFGVVLIPLVVLTRICWLRKLQRQRNETINEVRQIVDQRFQEEQRRRSGIFSIDLSTVPFEDIFGKLPSYQESLANPCTGSPPPYDHPPCYKEKESDENDNITSDSTREQDQVPSTSSDS